MITTYIKVIEDQKIRLEVNDKAISGELRKLGAKKRILSNTWTIQFNTISEHLKLIKKMIELGIPFEGGVHGWPPSEQLAQLRDEVKLSSGWKEISWRSRNEPII